MLPLRCLQLLRAIAAVNACFVANIKYLLKVSVKWSPADLSRITQVPVSCCRSKFSAYGLEKKEKKHLLNFPSLSIWSSFAHISDVTIWWSYLVISICQQGQFLQRDYLFSALSFNEMAEWWPSLPLKKGWAAFWCVHRTWIPLWHT